MFDAGMREMQRAKLELPGVGEDGGMHSLVLQANRSSTFDEPLWALPPFQKLMTEPATCIQLNPNLANELGTNVECAYRWKPTNKRWWWDAFCCYCYTNIAISIDNFLPHSQS
jgi:hypothetical protein